MNTKGDNKKKRDSLQAFLIFAAILLVALSALENWRRSRIEEGEVRAGQLTAKIGAGCTVHSTGFKGDVFLFYCPEEKNTLALSERIRNLGLQYFFIKTSYGRLQCREKCEPIKTDT